MCVYMCLCMYAFYITTRSYVDKNFHTLSLNKPSVFIVLSRSDLSTDKENNNVIVGGKQKREK